MVEQSEKINAGSNPAIYANNMLYNEIKELLLLLQ